jgi:antitoxin component of MazEF toxin-antitoxin module
MGVVTSLHLNATGKPSLKTTVPVFIVKQLNLKQRDKLEWSFEIHNNEMVVIVRKK